MENFTIKRKTNFNPLVAVKNLYASGAISYYTIEDDYGNEIYTLKATCYYLGDTGMLSGDKNIEVRDSDNHKIGMMYSPTRVGGNIKDINGNFIDIHCDITDRSYIKPTKSLLGGLMNGFREIAHSKDRIFGLSYRRWTTDNQTIYDSSKSVIGSYNFNKPGLFSKGNAQLSLVNELSQNDFLCALFLMLVYVPD